MVRASVAALGIRGSKRSILSFCQLLRSFWSSVTYSRDDLLEKRCQ